MANVTCPASSSGGHAPDDPAALVGTNEIVGLALLAGHATSISRLDARRHVSVYGQ
jgi:hypothetical protein